MYEFQCKWRGESIRVHAATTYEAKKLARERFQAKHPRARVRENEIVVTPSDVTHDPASI